ncbi:MAG: SH3 domain-containing protein [Candidatus Woesebacteria bacterium]|nr:MAG: SH3 domain-containing protein [Candidatus Woesebacteria bacterium]
MHKFERFLFFYSILAITVFFISFGVFSPSPLNFISGILMLPSAFYFWIRTTDPEHSSPNVWSVRFVLVLGLLSTFGIFGFYLASRGLPQIRVLEEKIDGLAIKNTGLQNELEKTNSELAKFKQSIATPSATVKGISTNDITVADLVAGSPTPGSGQRITGISGQSSINVYQSTSLSSPKIGTVDGSITYPYITKQDGWYKIVLTSAKTGWVNENQVVEIQ